MAASRVADLVVCETLGWDVLLRRLSDSELRWLRGGIHNAKVRNSITQTARVTRSL